MIDETLESSPEVSSESAAPDAKKAGRPKSSSLLANLLSENEQLKAENEQFKAELATKNAVEHHFEEISGFKDEHDRATEGHREAIKEAKSRGVDIEEVIERQLDSSEVRPVGSKGVQWLKAHRLKWINRKSQDERRISYHEGKGFFMVRPEKHPVKPSHGIKQENTWILGDTILMAEPLDLFESRRRQSISRMLHQSGEMREGTREQINQLIRNEAGQPHARPGITRSYRDNTWDRLEEGADIPGPSAQTISPS